MLKKFRIHFQGSMYSEELYDIKGRDVYTLKEAIEVAESSYGPRGWEVYNGDEAENRYIESMNDSCR